MVDNLPEKVDGCPLNWGHYVLFAVGMVCWTVTCVDRYWDCENPTLWTVTCLTGRSAQQSTLFLISLYSGTLQNGHPSTADTHDITDDSKPHDSLSIYFHT